MPLGCLALGGSRVTNDELVGRAKAIVEANRYMMLATADEAGRPWASPVWYATGDYRDFFWCSRATRRRRDCRSGHTTTCGPHPAIASTARARSSTSC
jgi:Pyridoxamine 5'-phosphate oxidase